MSALTSLLVRDRVVPVSKIEEALQSQVFLGGDLEIILLEMNLVPEDVLSAYRAALFDLLPATREEVMRASREALRRVSPELARAVGMVPLLFEGRTLVVAAWEPIYEPRLSEIEGQLGCELSVRIVNGARLSAGLAHHYGFELDPRLRRLSDAMRRRDPGVVPFVRPPSPSMRPATHLRPREDEPEEEPELTEGGEQRPPVDVAVLPAGHGADDAPAEALPAAIAADEVDYVDVEAERATIPRGVAYELAPLTRAPLSYEAALDLLARLGQRDEVLFVLLRYVQQFLPFVCIFSVSRDGIRARMAQGGGLPAEIVETAFVESPRVGVLAQAAREGRPVLGSFGDAPEERAAAVLLQREEAPAGLVVPIALNGRVVLLVYADDVRGGITLEHAELVHALVPAVLDALRRIIIEQKAQRREQYPSTPEPSLPPVLDRTPVEAREQAAMASAPAALSGWPSEPAAQLSSELSAVDLDAFDRQPENGALPALVRASARVFAESREAALLRERLPGIPRAAPPPPDYESSGPQAVTASYHQYRSAGSLAEDARARAAQTAQPDAAPADPEASDRKSDRNRLSLVEETSEPTVIIDMGESVDSLIASLQHAPPHSDPPEVAELLALGEGVLPVLLQRFPGPLWFDRTKPHKVRPRGRDVSALARAISAFGPRAAPYLVSVLAGADTDRCYYALMLAREIVHPDLLDPVARRVLDRDDGLRALALEALRSYAGMPHYEVVLRAISDLSARPGKDAQRQLMAVEALGELRDARSLPALLARLRDRDEQVVVAAHKALVVLTGQDFGFVPRKWESWAEGWGRAHRVEWLIESLLHNDESVRALASDEIKQLTQQYFGYHPALPRRDREVAQRKYREWWELEGRLAFGR